MGDMYLATLVACYSRLVEVAEAYPEAGYAIDQALEFIDMAGHIIDGTADLSACEHCGCTVEDGECICPPGGCQCDGADEGLMEWPDGALESTYGSDHEIGDEPEGGLGYQ